MKAGCIAEGLTLQRPAPLRLLGSRWQGLKVEKARESNVLGTQFAIAPMTDWIEAEFGPGRCLQENIDSRTWTATLGG